MAASISALGLEDQREHVSATANSSARVLGSVRTTASTAPLDRIHQRRISPLSFSSTVQLRRLCIISMVLAA